MEVKQLLLKLKEKKIDENILNPFQETCCLEYIVRYPQEFLNNSSKNNFENNLKTINNKILSINEYVNYDEYVSYSCILGAFLADSMGSFCEFSYFNKENKKKIFVNKNVFHLPPGQITDDSEMALSLAYSIMEHPSKNIDINIIYFFYSIWKFSNPFDIGNTIVSSLTFDPFKDTLYQKLYENYKKNNYNNESKSNGFLMRLTPLIVYCYYNFSKNYIKEIFNSKYVDDKYNLFVEIKKIILNDCLISHPNEECICIATLYVYIGLMSLIQMKTDEIFNEIKYFINLDKFKKEYLEVNKIISDLIKEILDFSDFEKRNYLFKDIDKKNRGYYLHSIKLILFYLKFYNFLFTDDSNPTIFRFIMNDICNYGGDTDTNGAIVMGIFGPIIGFKNFGSELKILLDYYNEKRFLYTTSLIYFYMEHLKKLYVSNLQNEMSLLNNLETLLNNKIEEHNNVILYKKLNFERNKLKKSIENILKIYDEVLNKKNPKIDLKESNNDFKLLDSVNIDSKKDNESEENDKINNNNNKICIINIIAHMLYNKIN